MFFGAIAAAFIIFFIIQWAVNDTVEGLKEERDKGTIGFFWIGLIVFFIYIAIVGFWNVFFTGLIIASVVSTFFLAGHEEDGTLLVIPLTIAISYYFYHVYLDINGLLSAILTYLSTALIAPGLGILFGNIGGKQEYKNKTVDSQNFFCDDPSKWESESSTVVSDKVK